MVSSVKGDVVIVPFPFSDLSTSKRRPALVLADLTGSDVILCQITSQTVRDAYAISITDSDFVSGGLRQDSDIRPNRLFTANSKIVLYQAGSLSASKVQEVVDRVVEIINS